ncbi:hypothetical protein BU23DRAFT_5247 [Bimuria novae-zelandiae CBS 107.79]|uniref:Uncharacterized protein n=1 Tax=Bimuria novae-zelandiae CBS 107.79 TaxID=1447943 RepID=A0A6A5VSC2_9PLEO|nr:hypothetical protein BU23DRAFT_5247 [Bimuria novae-zelandiae CBS 107.79]
MSTGSRLGVHSDRPDIVARDFSPNTDEQRAAGQHIVRAVTPKQGITRHYTSFKEHADAVQNAIVMPGGGQGSSSRVEDRHTGFTWEFGNGEEPRQATPLPHKPPTPHTPPILEELSRRGSKADAWGDVGPVKSDMEALSRTSTRDLSTIPSLTTPARTDTNRSSFSGLARGMMRHVPDVLMFHPTEKTAEVGGQYSDLRERQKSRDERHTQFNFNPAVPKLQLPTPESAPGTVDVVVPKPGMPPKATLKDRRHFAQRDAMKLTLPPNMPDLPVRGRTPMGETSSLAPSRPRSPKTPWIQDRPPEWHNTNPKSAPATILEEEDPALLLRKGSGSLNQVSSLDKPKSKVSKGLSFGRILWRSSKRGIRVSDASSEVIENSGSDSRSRPGLDQPSQVQQGFEELGARPRARRFRWGGQGSSRTLGVAPRSELPRSPLSIGRFVKPKHSQQLLASAPPVKDQSNRNRKQTMFLPDLEVIYKMPVPPSFVPPGLVRVPTPPMFDAGGEVKGKLADFFFDLQGVRTHKAPQGSSGVWDSDALLMSQDTDLGPPSSETDDSPRDPISESPSNLPNHPLFPIRTTATGGGYTPTTPAYDLADANLARAGADPMNPKDPATRGAEEIAKLEWLTPEHLPSSPLCPLHEKYSGPSTGLCVYHGKKAILADLEARIRRQSAQQGMSQSGHREPGRDSRSMTVRERSQSAALDGSEEVADDRGEGGDMQSERASTKRRRRKWWLCVSSP